MEGSSYVPIRPARLPKIHRLNSRNEDHEKIRASLKNRNIRKQKSIREKRVAHLERDVCRRFIDDGVDAALAGSYEDKCRFLNQVNALITETLPESLNSSEFFDMMCSKALLFLKDDHPCIRAMAFRLLRLCLFTERNLKTILYTHVDIYVVRSLDLWVDNEMERSEALQLIASMIYVYESSNLKKLIESTAAGQYAFPKSIMQPVIAIALKAINTPRSKDNGSQPEETADNERDRLALPCMSLFFELCIYEPPLILEMAGTDWMVRVLTGNAAVSRRLAALVGRILVAWLDDPTVRIKAQLHLVLEQIFAPLIEFGFFQKNSINNETADRMVECVMENFSYSFLCILRSWSGLFACAAVGPNSTVIASSPLRLLEYLGLGTVGNDNLSRIRDMIVDICCDFMDLPYANKSFQSWEEAVRYYGSVSSPDNFNASIKDDFVLAQSEMLVNNDPVYSNHVDLLSSFRALAFFILVNAGLAQSLSRLIVAQPDAPSAIKATLLMSDMLRTAPAIVPTGWRASVLSMPSLMQSACEALANSKAAAATHGYYDPDAVEQFTFVNAENAELVLHRFDMLNRVWIHNATVKPSTDSNYALFLHPPKIERDNEFTWRRSDADIQNLLDECVTHEKLNVKVASILFKLLLEDIKNVHEMDDADAERLLDVVSKTLSLVSPSLGVQTHWVSDRSVVLAARNAILVCMELRERQQEVDSLLSSYIHQFKTALDSILNPPNTGLFSMKNLIFGGSSYHFALAGAMSTHTIGLNLLEKAGVMQLFMDMMHNSTNVEYVKLVVSCLDYSHSEGGPTSVVLQKALTATSEPSRRWCTRFMSALASLRIPFFENWGMRLLLAQLGDPSVKVVRHAIRILHAWLPIYPYSVRLLRAVRLDAFGEAGTLLRAHYYSNEDCCSADHDGARDEVHLWMESFNERYFECIDDDMRVALLSVRRSLNGGFSRSSGERLEKYGLRSPVHLFASLARHESGRWLLGEEHVAHRLLARLADDSNAKAQKGAAVALGNIGSVDDGFAFLPPETVSTLVRMAEEAPVLSVRGAAFWALNIMAVSKRGAQALAELGWESNRHRYMVDRVRLETDRNEEVAELRRGTLTPVVPEISVDRGFRVDSPLANLILQRNRASSEVVSPSFLSRSRRGSVSTLGGDHPPDSPSPRPSILRRSRSDVGLSFVLESPSDGHDSPAPSASRCERTMTCESSAMTSGLGSYGDDSIGSRRRATTTTGSFVDEWEGRTRASTVAHCLSHGLNVDKSRLEAEGEAADLIRSPHFSTRLREKYHLAPLRVRNHMQVNRNVGDPVRYVYMTKDEEESLSEYRRVIMRDGWLWKHLQHVSHGSPEFETRSTYAVHTIALPAEVDIMCMNIFGVRLPSYSSASSHIGSHYDADSTGGRGAKSGHGRNKRTEASRAHSTYRCFYCSAKPQKYALPPDVDVSSLRRQVLNEVDMLEIIESAPEKKLISLRGSHGWLFEWPCLYADVLELLDQYRFKAKSRAFLQTIFYDALKLPP